MKGEIISHLKSQTYFLDEIESITIPLRKTFSNLAIALTILF